MNIEQVEANSHRMPHYYYTPIAYFHFFNSY